MTGNGGRRTGAPVRSGAWPVLAGCLLAGLGPALAGCSDGAAEAAPGSTAPVARVLQPAPDPIATTPVAATTRDQDGRAGRTSRRPDGTLRVVEVAGGFSLDLPRGFVRVTSHAALTAAIRSAGGDAGTRLRAAVEVAAPGGPGAGRLLAVDPARGAVITVLATPSGGADGADLTGQAAAIRSQLETRLDARVTMTSLRVDGEPALRGVARTRSGRMPVRLTEVYAVHAERFYTVVLAEAGRAEPAVAAQLLTSLRFLG